MKKIRIFAWVAVMTVLMAGSAAYAEHSMDESGAPGNTLKALKAEPVKASDGLVHLNNKVCPISGEETGKDTCTLNGVVYNLCCPMCSGKLKNNPSKYAIPSEEIQTVLAGVKG